MFRPIVFSAVGCLLMSGISAPSLAQGNAKKAPTAPKAGSQLGVQESAANPQVLPDTAALNILIRRTLLTLNDANLSGNYTVLRDLAAPSFQSANDPAKLAEIFANFRKNKIDMAPIVLFDPKLVREPALTKVGMLRLSGFMPTRPQQINFDMVFEKVEGRWRLFAIAANTSPAKAAAVAPNGAGPANTNAKKSP